MSAGRGPSGNSGRCYSASEATWWSWSVAGEVVPGVAPGRVAQLSVAE